MSHEHFNELQGDYLNSLGHFPRYLANAWRDLGDGRAFFGDASHLEAGMRSMGNVVFTAALLASDPAFPMSVSDRQVLLRQAQAGLRYMTHGHVTGPGTCANGRQWGSVWQSSWWVTRMALGASLMWDTLEEPDKAAVERVIVFEADLQLSRIVPTGLFEDTKAEENAWDCEVLAVAIALFPAHEHHLAWYHKLCEFAYNTFSVAQDSESTTITDGKPLRDWVYTTNLHSDFTLENHGAYHFCYVASPLHSLAWADYALRSRRIKPPAALLHHVAEVWTRAKTTFLGTRFAYVSGQDWARYTYGAYFIVPVLAWLQYHLHDGDAAAIEHIRVHTLLSEQQENNDGSYFGKRFTQPHYYGQTAKYETDCYANLGLAYCLHRLLSPQVIPTKPERLEANCSGCHVSPECAIAFVRTPSLFASFSWRSLTEPVPQALFVPLADESLVEWQAHNLCGRIVLWQKVERVLWIRSMRRDQGNGFHIQGTIIYRGRNGRNLYNQEIDYEVMPDSHSARIQSRFIATTNLWVHRIEGLHLAIANDRFNSFRRTFYSENNHLEVIFNPNNKPIWLYNRKLPYRLIRRWQRLTWNDSKKHIIPGNWLNIDNQLGVISKQNLSTGFLLRSPLGRNLHDSSLHYDMLYAPLSWQNRQFKSGEEILTTDFLLVATDAQKTQELAQKI